MSRLEVPLRYWMLRTTGDTVLRAELVLSLRTNRGAWEEVPFRVDSGTEMTTMPAYAARKLDVPIPKQAVPGLILSGQEVRSGLLQARVVGMDQTEFVFPCYFIGDPSVPPRTQAPSLLGLTGVWCDRVDDVGRNLDRTPADWEHRKMRLALDFRIAMQAGTEREFLTQLARADRGKAE
jgi:hypothetical protein